MPTNDNDQVILLPLPIGTQVVSRVDYHISSGEIVCLAGKFGTVLRAPETPAGHYLVRLVNGIEATFPRRHLTTRKLITTHDIGVVGKHIMAGIDLFPYVIYHCIVGSQAYSLSHEHSDVDRRGFYLPSASLHWSSFGVQTRLSQR